MANRSDKVALVWPGDAGAIPTPALETSRLAAVADALRVAGLDPCAVVYADEVADDVRRALSTVAAALVWVNPIESGRDRTRLDAVLRDVAAAGVYVSAHPDVILALGTKEVLYTTRAMSWGGDTRCYRTHAALRDALPASLEAGGPRVLKQYRGNGGNGVWKLELLDHAAGGASMVVQVLHAQRGSMPHATTLHDFVNSCRPYFEGDGRMIDQPFASRLADGMIRCYLVGDRVEGFGEQAINALLPPSADGQPTRPGPRLYFPGTRADLQPLKTMLEDTWLPELCTLTGVQPADLPLIWDLDFLHGPSSPDGDDTYLLCEINVSCVHPFPDSAPAPMARRLVDQLAARRRAAS